MNLADEIRQTFVEESSELLASLEELLLDLEDDPSNMEKLNSVFRVMHTIKGSAGMVGETQISHFAHVVEDMFDSIRKGRLGFDSGVAGISLEARDIIMELLTGETQGIEERIREVERKIGVPEAEKEPEKAAASVSGGPRQRSWRISFTPSENTFLRGGNPLLLLQELQAMGEYSAECSWDLLPPLKNLEVDTCYLSWEIVLTTSRSEKEIREVFLFVESDSTLRIEEIAVDEEQKLGEILVDRGAVSSEVLKAALGEQKRIGQVLVEKEVVKPSDIKSALLEQEHLKKLQQKQQPAQNVRVSTEKLDSMVNLVGELVTTQAQLTRVAYNTDDRELSLITESLQRLVEELRDTALGIRMMPVGNTFGRFRRLVRDLSLELGKKIRMETVGEETELDKTVIDKLNEPLIHLIRNSVDHGIEMPDEREAAGKEAEGLIHLTARQAGGQVQIVISDDGKGINKEAVRKKAVDQGLISPESDLSDEEIYGLIFRNGFSTAQKVSNVSGRGVGMDVVRKEIENLQGTVSVQSRQGEYTRVTISLPLTLAIIDGLMVRVDKDHYILPLSAVEACLDRASAENRSDDRRNIISYRDQFLPFISLRKFLHYPEAELEHEQIVVAHGEGGRYGLLVDEVIGDHQTVIKNLGKVFKNARGFSGATILGDGRIALILNVGTLPVLYTEQN